MEKNQLDFNLAVRDWAATKSWPIVSTGSDDKIALRYKESNEIMGDEELELLRSGIARHINRLAFDHELSADLDFTDLGYGDLAVFVTIKAATTRAEAAGEYLDLLNLGPRMSPEQFQRLNALKKRYGFI